MRLVELLRDVESKRILVVVDGEDEWGPFRHEYPWSFIRDGKLVLWFYGEQPLHGFEIEVEEMRFDSVRPNMPRNIVSVWNLWEYAAKGAHRLIVSVARTDHQFRIMQETRYLTADETTASLQL